MMVNSTALTMLCKINKEVAKSQPGTQAALRTAAFWPVSGSSLLSGFREPSPEWTPGFVC